MNSYNYKKRHLVSPALHQITAATVYISLVRNGILKTIF